MKDIFTELPCLKAFERIPGRVAMFESAKDILEPSWRSWSRGWVFQSCESGGIRGLAQVIGEIEEEDANKKVCLFKGPVFLISE